MLVRVVGQMVALAAGDADLQDELNAPDHNGKAQFGCGTFIGTINNSRDVPPRRSMFTTLRVFIQPAAFGASSFGLWG